MIKYNGLVDYIRNNYDKMSLKELWVISKDAYGYTSSFDSFRKYVFEIKSRYNEEKGKTYKQTDSTLLDILSQNDIISIDDVCRKLNCNMFALFELLKIYKYQGFDIYNDGSHLSLSKYKTNSETVQTPLGENYIKFGVASDLHFGSRACQITALNEFAEECKKQNVKHMLVPGDILAGYKTYPGQEHDVYALTADDQEASCLANLPSGFDWWMLGGNHDYTFVSKGGGHNPLLKLQYQRNDIHYLGFDKAVIPLLSNVDCLLWHPSGGVPYSVSYRLQKGVEHTAFSELSAIANGNKPTTTIKFILAGHLHIQMQAMFGPIFGAQCGTFEGTTNYLVRKGLVPAIGGWIIEAWLDTNGRFKSFNAKFHMYNEIEDDWKNYKHSINSSPKIERAIFS